MGWLADTEKSILGGNYIFTPSPHVYEWKKYIDISGLKGEQRLAMEKSLNWLEVNFPGGFKQTLHEIKINMERNPKLGKVKFAYDKYDGGSYNPKTNTISLNFTPDYYLGKNGKLYQWTLSELALHELTHAGQNFPDYPEGMGFKDEFQELRGYLEKKGFDIDEIRTYTAQAYFNGIRTIAKDENTGKYLPLPDELKTDATLDRLTSAYIKARTEVKDFELRNTEDPAVDRTNELRAFLGKPLRGEYGLSDSAANRINARFVRVDGKLTYMREGVPLLDFKGTPKEIRKGGFKGIGGEDVVTITPETSGQNHAFKQSLLERQTAHDRKYNADTVNISPDEWRVIETVRAEMLGRVSVSGLTEEKMATITGAIDRLKQDFNKTSGNDAVTDQTRTELEKQGAGSSLPTDTAKSGWSR